jgi:TonB-linked SusC/RagA family outer membrane protein
LVAALLTLAGSSASAQRRLSGLVTAGGVPVGNAGVSVQGTTTGTYTSDDGRYVMTVKEGPLTLVVRRLGYRRQLVSVTANQSEVNVSLERDVLELEHVVVTGTATSVSSVNAANAVATVTAEQLNRAPTPTLENALQGKIAGAVITTNSGAPGGGSQVQLRGATSINANASPLYVVDGVLVSNAQISNALNSVTNAGSGGFNGSAGLNAGGGIGGSQDQMVNRIADLNPADIETIEVLKGASAGAIYGSKASAGVIIITTKRGNAGRPQFSVTQRAGQFSLSKKLGLRCFKTEAEAMAWAGVTDPADLAAPFTGQCNDFEKQYYSGNSPSYETDLSLRGGSSQGTTYYIAGLAKRDNAIAKGTYYQKQSLTANIGQTVGSRLTLRSNNEFIHSLTDRGISGNDNSPIVSPGDVFSGTPTWFDLKSGARNPFLAEGTNPFQTAARLKAPEDVFRYIGSVNGSISVYASTRQTLDVNVIGGIDALNYDSRITSPADLYFEPADGLPGTVTTNHTTSVQANVNASGVHKWTENRFTATTSFGLRKERRQSDQLLDEAQNVPAGAGNIRLGGQQTVSEGINLIKDLSYYAQEEFLTLSDRLLLTAALNSERSSVNGDDKKFYSYPKFAASYRLPWLPSVFDEFKLRAAYGKAGNQPPYGFKFTALTISVNDGVLGGRPSTIAGNPNIKPETSIESEGGFDAQLFNGRLAFEGTYFNKRVEDLILQAAVAPTTGFTTKYLNGGTMVNKGTELGLTATPVDVSGFQWVSRTTFAQVRGRVTRLDVAPFSPNVGAFALRFGLPWIQQGFSPTTVQVVDGCRQLNANGTCSAANRIVQNYESAPDYTMGFSNELRYRGFSLYGLVDWRKGGRVVNLTNTYFDASGLSSHQDASSKRETDFAAGKAVYLENGGFVKLREVTLAYALPNALTSRYFSAAKDIRLELAGRNLLTSTKYTGYDPEVSDFSNQNVGRFQDVTPYPPSRSVFFSLSASF